MNIISNNYGLGHDDLYIPNRGRIHTDNSIEIKYYDKPGNRLDKMAFSFTGDMGCEFGGGVSCYGNTRVAPSRVSSASCFTTASGSRRTCTD